MGIGTALSIGSSLLGALGKGKNSQQALPVSGFGTLPAYASKYAEEELFPRIKEWGERGYEGIPRRGLNAEDLDPNFGSRARVQLMNYYAMKEAADKEKAGESSDNEMAGKMLDGMVSLGAMMLPQHRLKQYISRTNGDPKLLGTLAKIMANPESIRGGMLRRTDDNAKYFDELSNAYRG